MGYGNYSYEAHRAIMSTRTSLPAQEVFRQRDVHPLMCPRAIAARECRDSASHPNSLAITLALDVTGSMGEIPELLAKEELAGLIRALMDHGIADPQVLFLAIGDAFHDRAPLQVGQFESTAELMDQWLTWCWLEGGGGTPGHESYELALYFAARHLEQDCLRLRNKRGYLFMTGDEKPYPRLSRSVVRSVLGDEIEDDFPLSVVVDEAGRSVEPFFLIPDLARRTNCERVWRDVLGDRVICMESPRDTTACITGVVAMSEGAARNLEDYARTLAARGVARERIGAVVRALLPWAASRASDGAPSPVVDLSAPLPSGHEPSGYRRVQPLSI
ncbi:MAG: VWA domain-containing protein [Polyangiaceae bacterium]|nr:VWA domain-containing protein [Polyangiaceae bacterium]